MTQITPGRSARTCLVLALVAACAFLTGCSSGLGQPFDTPEAGVSALVGALRAQDKAKVAEILGDESDDILASGDPVADNALRQEFLAAYDRKHSVQTDEDGASLLVGENDWPLPIPLVRSGGAWHFDSVAGREEILARRIGRNELFTIEACRAVVDAQEEYFAMNPTGTGSGAYATRFLSTPGKRDGLFWPTQSGEPPSPLGEIAAQAVAQGYTNAGRSPNEPRPFHGYFYRMLNAQGPWAPGGAKSYMNGERMTGGFGVIAYPATYDNSGIMTFMVSKDGLVYQKDLGPSSAEIANGMPAFDPSEGWEIVP